MAIDAFPSKSIEDTARIERIQADARRRYPDAAKVIDEVLAVHPVCNYGRTVAWLSCRQIQRAINAAKHSRPGMIS